MKKDWLAVINRFFARPSAVFWLVFIWSLGLLLISAQPIPSNDSFFYDGAVVNRLLHGRYANPTLSLALPISGNEVFCAYPPMYQAVLYPWMRILGTSAISAMAFHLVLFGLTLVVLLAILRELKVPAWCAHAGAAFLLVITFRDRPDSLAHLFGLAAIYACLVWAREPSPPPKAGVETTGLMRMAWKPGTVGAWSMAGLGILCVATSLQIGAIYYLLLWCAVFGACIFAKSKLPVFPLLAMVVVPAGLIALVVFRFPHLWAGFQEHARQTPSITGWRFPHFNELLKVARTVPGIVFIALLLPWVVLRREEFRARGLQRHMILTLACMAGAMTIIVAAMAIWTANVVFVAGYLQPIMVAVWLAMVGRVFSRTIVRWQTVIMLALACAGAIRAVGMSTWGLVCAKDVGYPTAIHRVSDELRLCPNGAAAVLSSAYLYEAMRHDQVRSIHSDWLSRAERGKPNDDFSGLVALKPAKVILTQFDYYRRYEPVFEELKLRPELADFRVENTARVPAPESYKSLRQVVQHISWAPVVVSINWK